MGLQVTSLSQRLGPSAESITDVLYVSTSHPLQSRQGPHVFSPEISSNILTNPKNRTSLLAEHDPHGVAKKHDPHSVS